MSVIQKLYVSSQHRPQNGLCGFRIFRLVTEIQHSGAERTGNRKVVLDGPDPLAFRIANQIDSGVFRERLECTHDDFVTRHQLDESRHVAVGTAAAIRRFFRDVSTLAHNVQRCIGLIDSLRRDEVRRPSDAGDHECGHENSAAQPHGA